MLDIKTRRIASHIPMPDIQRRDQGCHLWRLGLVLFVALSCWDQSLAVLSPCRRRRCAVVVAVVACIASCPAERGFGIPCARGGFPSRIETHGWIEPLGFDSPRIVVKSL